MTDRFLMMAALVLSISSACNCSPQGSGSAPPIRAPEQAASSGPAPSAPPIALPPVPPADPREPLIAAAVSELLQKQHLTARKIDDVVARKAIDAYIEHLDPTKQFLLKPQVEVLRRGAEEIGDQLAAGDLRLARLGTALLTAQRKKVAEMVASLSSQPFDFTDVEYFEADPDKRDFAENDEALRDLWRRNLERQVLERVDRMREASERLAEGGEAKPDAGEAPTPAEELPTTEEGREKKARTELAEALEGNFQRRIEPEPLEAVETFLNALAAVYCPHTLYLAPDDKANFDIQMTGSLEGIGAVLSEGDHYIEVQEVVPGGAAWRQGELEAGDLILSVAQEKGEPVDVTDMRIAEVVKMIRGPKGTVVTLSVRKPDGRLVSIVITRDVVVVEATYARGALLKLEPKAPPVGYIYLPSFYGNTRPGAGEDARSATEDVRALLKQFDKRHVQTAVLDLRGNGGGLLTEATRIVGLFIEQGPVVQIRTSDGVAEMLGDPDPELAFGGRLVILVDRLSASASEIVAGALQDYGRALVVGPGPTHGKGTVQLLVDLDHAVLRSPAPLGVFKLTTQQFFLVDGESTQQRGVQPDVLLPDPLSYLEVGERFLDNPVPWSKVQPLPHRDWSGPGWDVEKLVALSRAQLDQSTYFSRLAARNKYLEARKEDTKLPLQQQAWRARIEAQEKALDAFELDPEDQPARLSVTPVSYRPPKQTTKESAKTEAEARAAAAERIDKWRGELERDPWVEHTLQLVRAAQPPGGARAGKAGKQ